MATSTAPGTDTLIREEAHARADVDVPWVVIVWNDPVNLMSYVSYVFQSYFGYSEAKAHRLMMEVHEAGKSVVAAGSREAAERDTLAMHSYGLWATFQRQDTA